MASKDKAFYSKNTLNLNGNILDLSIPKVMGIINVTDDSFYDGGKYISEKKISQHAEKLINEGADILDIGGYSSRPGAKHIDESTEIKRIQKGINSIRSVDGSIPISVDTFRSSVAMEAIEMGAGMINDISGGNLDRKMFQTISSYKVSYVLMHMVGTPQNMTQNTQYDNIISEMVDFFSKKLRELTQFGIKDVIIDVGFGFSKTTPQNYILLNNLKYFRVLNTPILVGISRKSMIYKVLGTEPGKALNGTTALHAVALLSGAKLLRVHDVSEAKEVIGLLNQLKD